MTLALFMTLENVRIATSVEIQGFFSEFFELRLYYEYLEEYLKQSHNKLNEKYKDEFKKYPNDPNLGGNTDYEDWGRFELYPNILRKSFIITIISYFEKELFTLCKNLKDLKKSPLDIPNSKGKGNNLDKVKKYIKEVSRVDISNDNITWEEITRINKIRNLIVHNNGHSYIIQLWSK